MAAKFEDVDFGARNWPAIIISSVAFGAMHRDRWIAGSLAGALYAGVMIRRRSLIDAIVAHSPTNALVAALVLMGGRWDLWESVSSPFGCKHLLRRLQRNRLSHPPA